MEKRHEQRSRKIHGINDQRSHVLQGSFWKRRTQTKRRTNIKGYKGDKAAIRVAKIGQIAPPFLIVNSKSTIRM